MKPRAFDILCLIILLTFVGLRPLVSESFHTSGSTSELAPGLHDPATWHTLLINIAILATALAVAGYRMLIDKKPLRTSGIELGAMVLLMAAIGACWGAADARPARLAAIDLLGALALAWALVQLIETNWQRLLTLAVILASGMVNVAESYDQAFYTMRETQKQYELDREAFWAEKGVPLDSPQVTMFENRMRSREASGYFSHSNVFGGYLLLSLFAAIASGLYAYRIRPPDGGVGLVLAYVVLAVAAGLAVYLSRSMGAMVSAALMLAGVGFVLAKAAWWDNHRPQVFGWAICLVVFAIVGVEMYGHFLDSLPGASLDFRWQYWRASGQMFGEHWMTGVGPENFGDAYLAYKPITSAEEVKNPHNGLVQFATEYGLIGLAGIALVLLGGAKAYACATRDSDKLPGAKRSPENDASIVPLYGTCVIAITFGVFLLRFAMLPSQNPAFVLWSMIIALPVWLIVHAVGMLLANRAQQARLPAARWMPAIGFALAAFLLQDTINFAFFVPGARTTFAAVFALAVAPVMRDDDDATPTRSPLYCLIPLSLAGSLGWAVFDFSRVMPAEIALNEARMLAGSGAMKDTVSAKYHEAQQRDRLDSAIPEEHARWLTAVATSSQSPDREASLRDLSEAVDAIDEALARAPAKYGLYRVKSQIHLLRHRLGVPQEAERAVSAMQRALKLYPARPKSHVELADCLVEVGTCDALKKAIKHLKEAVELDNQRPEAETIRRFSRRTQSEIEARTKGIEKMIQDRGCHEAGE
ncbi:MAG: O-antigen ligase family protein [Phycisphaerales bacterium]|nr:O-antigen ligase family protein [Phycisphaerales bacterium]